MCKAIVEYTQEMIEFGDINGLNKLGFGNKVIESLSRINSKDLQKYGEKLVASNDLFDITADEVQIELFLEAIAKQREMDENAESLIKLGAPQSMLASLAGLSDHEFRRRRNKIKITHTHLNDDLLKKGTLSCVKPTILQHVIALRDTKRDLDMTDFLELSRITGANIRDIWTCFQEYEKLGQEKDKL